MAFKFPDRQVKSVGDLLKYLKKDEGKLAGDEAKRSPAVWFRGLERATYELVPTFHRENLKIRDEIYMMNIFKQNAHESLTQTPASEWEWMFLMRHHGLSSRLLDWTENPLVGLFFAVRPKPRITFKVDSALWCLLPNRLNELALGWPRDSDILPMFTDKEAEYSLVENEALLNYLPLPLRTAQSTGKSVMAPAAGISVRTTRRIQAQLGVFTIHHADKTALQAVGNGRHIWRFIIPGDHREQIRQELRRIGITRRTMFPELDNVALDASQSTGRQ